MKLAKSATVIICSLFLLASCASLNPEAMPMREGGFFQITRMGPRHAQFQFSFRKAVGSPPKHETVEVSAERDEDIQRAVARKMIDVIRQYQKEDFQWESYRLGRTVVLSARMEDSQGLEDFFMREFFINDQLVEVDPKQANDLRKIGIQGKVIAEGVITSEGIVREPVIVESSNPALEKLVIEAILKYRFKPLLTRPDKPAPGRYRQTFDFGLAGIDERVSKYDLPKKADHLPIEFQDDTLPVVKVAAPVVYPFNLLKGNISGSAKVTVIVDPDGDVQKVEIQEATHPEFGLATRGMMQSWEFEPATKNGKPVWSIFSLEQKFNTHARGTEVSQSAKEILKNLQSHSLELTHFRGWLWT
jgi:TonB family protein